MRMGMGVRMRMRVHDDMRALMWINMKKRMSMGDKKAGAVEGWKGDLPRITDAAPLLVSWFLSAFGALFNQIIETFGRRCPSSLTFIKFFFGLYTYANLGAPRRPASCNARVLNWRRALWPAQGRASCALCCSPRASSLATWRSGRAMRASSPPSSPRASWSWTTRSSLPSPA